MIAASAADSTHFTSSAAALDSRATTAAAAPAAAIHPPPSALPAAAAAMQSPAASPVSSVASVSPSPPPAAAAPAASESSKKSSLGLRHMLAGSLAGMGSRTLLQPLDLVKVRLQVQDGSGRNEYKGLIDGMRTILRNDGFFGLYRGLTPNLMASGVSWGVYFFTYNHAKTAWRKHLTDGSAESARLGPVAHLSCAAMSGTCATFFTNPFSMVKTRLQLQGKEINSDTRVYRGVFDAFVRITREEGFLTLYRGIGPSLVLVSNGALQFMSYEELKRLTIAHLLPSHDESELHAAHFLAMGALAKVFSASVTYPMAVTRARLYQRKPDDMLKQTTGNANSASSASSSAAVSSSPAAPSASPKHVDGKYQSMGDVVSKIWRLEGWRGFYRGLGVMLIKTAPSSAITFLIYESTIKILHAEPKQKHKY